MGRVAVEFLHLNCNYIFDYSKVLMVHVGTGRTCFLFRWASLDDDHPKERVDRSSKKHKKAGDTSTALPLPAAKGNEASGTKKAVRIKKSVRWPDQVVHTGGFSIGGASKQQVCHPCPNLGQRFDDGAKPCT
jgi:hypothetical protein